MSEVNYSLRTLYNVDAAQHAKTPDQVRTYMQAFVETTYEMASALVDANTMDSIDPERCFSPSTHDVCRLKYWEAPTRLRQRENYVDKTALLKDQVSLKNYNKSLMDCRYQPAASPHDCLNWKPIPDGQLNTSISTNAMGLTGEDPIIMDSRRQYPFRSVVALAPIVWQSRSQIVPCSGFGNRYNEEVLNAGLCTVDEPCDPEKTTNFKATKHNPLTNRKQSIFISYSEDAFFCVDHAKEAEVWYDKSWHPWATMDDLLVGRRLLPRKMGNKNVFWKFITDTAYLMGPINGTIFFNPDDPCSLNCSRWGPPCVDPVEVGPSHPMWLENSFDNCSMRREWIRRFLRAEKEHRFIDIQTSEVTIASLVMTPQGKDHADITTLVRVTFKIEQNGAYTASVGLTSVSETALGRWYASVIIALGIAVLFIAHALHEFIVVKRKTDFFSTAFDILCALTVILYLVINIQCEQGDNPASQLMEAFKRNSQNDYFQSFAAILDFAEMIDTLKTFGFIFIVILFFRLVHMLSFHPRLGLMVSVVEECLDDVFHFLVQFSLMYLVLGFLGWWKFGLENQNFRSIFVSCYTLLRYFIGEFNFPDQPPGQLFIVYLLIYMFVVTIILVNFLLAIIVNAHTTVMENISQSEAEKNVFTDIWESTLNAWKHRLVNGYPIACRMQSYINNTIQENDSPRHELPAVTPEELYFKVLYRNGKPRFPSLEVAQDYVAFYASKMPLSETRLPLCFASGHYLGETEEDSLGQKHRIASAIEGSLPAGDSGDYTASKVSNSSVADPTLSIGDAIGSYHDAAMAGLPDGALSNPHSNAALAAALAEQRHLLDLVLKKLADLEKKGDFWNEESPIPSDAVCSTGVQTDENMSSIPSDAVSI
eukprot:TRINITY_DN32158_c0_g1_i1.p1 TRINITY_DN32158_c0_g1~~TRINITY_DN32158_c0_g1_i1.p1  ORF type:complete len:980 (+),score=124.55 TRINITY_DN32158_c0_g1_i1:309-2942(+)